MKTYKFKKVIFLTISMILLGFVGCKKFLQEDARNFINPGTFYQSQADAEGGIAGIYQTFNIGTGEGLANILTELNSINSDFTWPWSMTAYEVGYNVTPDFYFCNNSWAICYDGIKRANSFIDAIEAANPIEPVNVKNRQIGEAKFLRSLFYFYLVQIFGDVPLITKTYISSDNFFVTRDSTAVVWRFVKSDLLDAINLLPHKSAYSGSDIARPNQESAKMLLAKIYMIQNDWPNAKQYVDKIIASNEYQLVTNVFDNYRIAKKHGIESIFEVDYASGYIPSLGSTLFKLTMPANLICPLTGKPMGGAWAGVAFSPDFYNSFDAGDQRLQLFFTPGTYVAPVGRYFTNKYFDPTVMTISADCPVNWVVFRYADVLLMKAEIENELNAGPNAAAYDAIDMVRVRANLAPLARVLDYNGFLDAVFTERAKELFAETHRFFDLKRRGYTFLVNKVLPARLALFNYIGFSGPFVIKESELVWPISTQEMDVNPKLVQNPGYGY